MRFILLIVSFSFLASCVSALYPGVPVGTDDDKARALAMYKPENPADKVYYFHLKKEHYFLTDIRIDNKRACTLYNNIFCRVELSPGPHYLQIVNGSPDSVLEEDKRDLAYADGARWKTDSESKTLFVTDKKDGPVLMMIGLHTKDIKKHPKYNLYSYFPFQHIKTIHGEEKVISTFKNMDFVLYSKPYISAFNTSYITPEDQKEWDLYGNTNSIESLKNFKQKYPDNAYIHQADARIQKLDSEEEREYRAILSRPSLEKWVAFVGKNPVKARRDAALDKIMHYLKTPAERRMYVSKYPSLISRLPTNERMELELLAVGPDGLKVSDILALSKEGFSTSTLASKIRASESPYRNYSFQEISTLKSMGMNNKLVNAMIDANTAYDAQMKRARDNKQLMEQIQNLIANSGNNIAAADIKNNPNTPVECLKQMAALKACDETGGFLKMACKTTAKASFPCNM